MLEEIIKKNFPFFEAELREAIISDGMLKEVEAGEALIEEDQYIRSFPILISGLIKVSRMEENGNELLLYYLQPGEVCTVSLSCCMERTKSRVRAIAEEETSVVVLPVELLDKWMSDFQTWKEFVMISMRKRFDDLLNTLDSIAFLKMDERLERFFSNRYKTSGQATFTGSHQDIALSLNTSREVISRLLKQMEKKGMISLSRNRVDYSPLCD